jgi:isopentenyl phosphate kinase
MTMTEDESQTDRNAAAQVLREIADEVQAGTCRGFGIVCAGGSVGYAAAGLYDEETHDYRQANLPDLARRLVRAVDPTITAITDYSAGAEFERVSRR